MSKRKKLFISNKIIASKKIKDDIMDEKQAKILELLEEGKTIKEASKEANTLELIVNRWIQLGKDGDERYTEFYKEYENILKREDDETRTPNNGGEALSNEELINMSISLLKEEKNFQEISEILEIPNFRINNWYYQGRLGIKPFDKFYNTCLELKIELHNEKKQKIETFKGKELRNKLGTLKPEEIEYILEYNEIEEIDSDNKKNLETINDTLTLKEIEVSLKKLDELEQKRFKINKILEKSSFSTILNLLEEEDRPKYKNSSSNNIINRIFERLKLSEYEEFLELLSESFYEEEETEEIGKRKCEICGKELSDKETEKCKKCKKKSNTAKILIELLNSISPEVPFYSDDLKNLGLEKPKINHYIWSLEDYDLIKKEKNNKYSLVSQDKLDEFIEKYGEGDKPIENTNKVKLSKKCKICEKTLAIGRFIPDENSEDGYGNICKKCKKHVKAANYVKYILKWKKPEEAFKKEDIVGNYNKSKTLTAHIWTLLDLDLIEYYEETEQYSLKSQSIIDKFLEDYFIKEEYDKFEVSVKKDTSKKVKKAKKQTLDDFVEKAEEYKEKHSKTIIYNRNELVNNKMNLLINSLKSGKSLEDACLEANLPESIIQSWIRFAKQGNNEYLKFYKDYLAVTTHDVLKEGQTEEEADQEELNQIIESLGYAPEKHKIIIDAIREGKTINEASKLVNVHINDLIKWYKNGKNGIKPFDSYYSDYNEAREYYDNKMLSKRIRNFENEETQERINIFLEAIKEGKTRDEASELSGIKLSTINLWVSKGNKGDEKYSEFANNYKKAREIATDDAKKLEDNEKEIKEFLNYIREGKTRAEACELSNLELKVVQNWITQGKLGKEEFVNLAKEYDNAREEAKTKKEIEELGWELDEVEDEIFNNIKIIIVELNEEIANIILKGKIKNNELINTINRLKEFENGIDKILTNRLSEEETELFIELTLNNDQLNILRKLISEN